MYRVYTHPGIVLKEEFMKPNDESALNLAQSIKVDSSEIEAFIEGEIELTPTLAVALSNHYGTTISFWKSLYFKHLESKFEFGCDVLRHTSQSTINE